MDPQNETTSVSTIELRRAIAHVRSLIEHPNNIAAKELARISMDTLAAYILEDITEEATPLTDLPKKG